MVDIRINNESRYPLNCHLTIDGQELYVDNYELRFNRKDGLNILSLDFQINQVDIDVNGELKINGCFLNDEIKQRLFDSLKNEGFK